MDSTYEKRAFPKHDLAQIDVEGRVEDALEDDAQNRPKTRYRRVLDESSVAELFGDAGQAGFEECDAEKAREHPSGVR
jgi:hypothetical protein